MTKLWKGIFYCEPVSEFSPVVYSRSTLGFWMSDKPLVQQALAAEIAEIVLAIPSLHASLDFLRGFWEATVREWSGIDRLRFVSSRICVYPT